MFGTPVDISVPLLLPDDHCSRLCSDLHDALYYPVWAAEYAPISSDPPLIPSSSRSLRFVVRSGSVTGDVLLCSRFVRSVTVKSTFIVWYSRTSVLCGCCLYCWMAYTPRTRSRVPPSPPAPPQREASSCDVSLAILASAGPLAAS